MRGGTHQDKSP